MTQPLGTMVEYLIALQDALGGHYGELSRPQLRLMMKLPGDSPAISQLAEQLHISSPGVTQMIDKLQGRGYVTRYSAEKDQRIVRVAITALGRDILQEAKNQFAGRVEQVLAGLSDAEQATLLDLLRRLFELGDGTGKKMAE
ncbi:MAG: MarR family transcriptional regulator [Thermaerobacter sp.]|nr:MarR family transcriptional regulator [Thermaerobacter sp.]